MIITAALNRAHFIGFFLCSIRSNSAFTSREFSGFSPATRTHKWSTSRWDVIYKNACIKALTSIITAYLIMWNSQRHCFDLPFIQPPLRFFVFFITFPIAFVKCISPLYSALSLHYSASSHVPPILMFHRSSSQILSNPIFSQIQHFPLFASTVFVFSFSSCSCFSLPDPSLFIPSIYSPRTDSQLIAAVYYPASVCLIRMSVAVWGCLTRAQWLNVLTAHKRAVIPCVKDCYWHGPFNLTPSKLNGPSSLPNLYSHPLLYSHLCPPPRFFRTPDGAKRVWDEYGFREQSRIKVYGVMSVPKFCLWNRIWS